jgi:hypothetical protein
MLPKIIAVMPDDIGNEVTVSLRRPKQEGAVLLVAVYEDKELVKLTKQTVTKSGSVTVSIEIPGWASTVKAMVWEGFGGNISPLCEAGTAVRAGGGWVMVGALP